MPNRLCCFLANRPEAVTSLTRMFLTGVERLLIAAAGATCDDDTPRAAPTARRRLLRPPLRLGPQPPCQWSICQCFCGGGPPTDWEEFVRTDDDGAIFQASPDELTVIDIHLL